MKFVVIGNCQTLQVNDLLSSVHGLRVDRIAAADLATARPSAAELARYDFVVVQDVYCSRYPEFGAAFAAHPGGIAMPALVFTGYHPDQIETNIAGTSVADSRIIAGAYEAGLGIDETAALFRASFFDRLGYYSSFGNARRVFTGFLSKYTGIADFLFDKWADRGPFMYTKNHPRMFVTEDILRDLLRAKGVELAAPASLSDNILDPLAKYGIFPTLNHPASQNRLDSADCMYSFGARFRSLRTFIDLRFRAYDSVKGDIHLDPAEKARFLAGLQADRAADTRITAAKNPYAGRPRRHMWANAVAQPAREEVAPTAKLQAFIGKETKVSTAGSCFAQHIAKTMAKNGLCYHVTETGPAEMTPEDREKQTYGLFSARYGNIYSPRQLLQLIHRAYGRFASVHSVWEARGGGYLDPFRPNLGVTFPSPEAVLADRESHLAAVRQMFETLDVFVFTLGLTECWTDRRDGTAFPVAPGVVAQGVDAATIEFRNFDSTTVHADMVAFLQELKRVNPACKVILTVSPVPLIATYSENDALTATTYSKSVLRAVAGELESAYGFVHYFPSFEIITGNHSRGAYFEPDLRSVRAEGVAHVMRIFMETLVTGAEAAPAPVAPVEILAADALPADYVRELNVICDEELITRDL